MYAASIDSDATLVAYKTPEISLNIMPKTHQSILPDDEQAVGAEMKPNCGIIMPMSDKDGYTLAHWGQVKRLIVRAAERVGFTASIVGGESANDMIQANMVRGLYQSPVVVCDVSSLNANVMIELGIRMATLLPLIIIFDGELKYPFDINQFARVEYSKALNYEDAEAFESALSEKIRQVVAAQNAGTYQAFLSHFQEVIVTPLEFNDTAKNLTDALHAMRQEVSTMRAEITASLDTQGQQIPIGAYCSLPTIEEKAALSSAWTRAHDTKTGGMLPALPDLLKGFLLNEVIRNLYEGYSNQIKAVRRESLIPYIDYYCQQQKREKNGDSNPYFSMWPPMRQDF